MQIESVATKAGVEGRQALKIHTPLIAMTKKQIVEAGLKLGVDYAQGFLLGKPSSLSGYDFDGGSSH